MNFLQHPQSPAELAALDALLADRHSAWWDGFYADRARPVPFFGSAPDECLHEWIRDGLIAPHGTALDLGCGNGRNAVLLARSGFAEVTAVDYSQAAIAWAAQRAGEAGVSLRLQQASVFDLALATGGYDLVYDSGLFHHLPPHRRDSYLQLVAAALKPGGHFGMVCFRPEGGSGLSDAEVYERRSLGGGLGYSESALHEIWDGGSCFRVRQLRQMKPQRPAESGLFGEGFLWAMLAQRQ